MRLKEVRKESSDVYSFIFAPEQEITWQAGQYLRYTLDHASPDDRGISRFFTIASAPFEKNIQLATRISLEKGSSFKKALVDLVPNSTIEAFGPSGKFVVEDEGKYVFVAGGIGITPFRSILLDLNARGQEIDVVLMYANRTEEIPFKDELEKLKISNPEFRIEYFIGDEKIDAQAIQDKILDFKERMFYISGPKPMVEALSTTIRGLGVDESKIREDFFPGYTTH